MAYKARFQPSEILAGGVWRTLAANGATAHTGAEALLPETTGLGAAPHTARRTASWHAKGACRELIQWSVAVGQ